MSEPLARFNTLVDHFSKVQGYIDQARSLAHKFHPAVVERVIAGHARTINDLLVDIVPAMAEVEEASQGAAQRRASIESDVASSRAQLEELELRSLIGELKAEELAEQRAPHDDRIAAVAADLGAVDEELEAMRSALARWDEVGRQAGVLQG